MQEGRLFEDKARIGIQPRAAEEMSEESVESVPKPPSEAAALVINKYFFKKFNKN